MKIKKVIYLLSFIISTFSVSAHASSPVWKVSKGNHHLYLGGTIHLLGKADYPLPMAFDKAYQDSSRLVFEADLHKLQSPEYQKIFMEKLMYSGNESIKDVLNDKTFTALEKHFSERGLPLEQILKFKPGMLVMMLTVFELQRLNIAGMGVDDFYIQKGLTEGKQFAYLEEVEEQLSFIEKMGQGNANEMITYTLRDIGQLAEQMAAMKTAWREGDNVKFKDVALTPWKQDFPELYHTLLVKRNNKWILKIESMLKTKEVEFILFGALHLVGDDGVLAQLKARGYTIQKL